MKVHVVPATQHVGSGGVAPHDNEGIASRHRSSTPPHLSASRSRAETADMTRAAKRTYWMDVCVILKAWRWYCNLRTR